MKLTKIKIENYRCIKSLEFDFEKINGKNCHMLIGVNETGKSNILKAMQFLEKNLQINYQHDCNRQSMQTAESIKVTYIFEDINNNQIIEMLRDESSKDLIKGLVFDSISKEISYNDKSQRQENYSFGINKSSIEKLKKHEELWKLVEKGILSSVLDDNELLSSYLNKTIADSLNLILPKVIFWKYAPQYLINEPINLNTFKNNPDSTSIPLRNLFLLKGIPKENFGKYIDSMLQSTQIREQAETELSRSATEHINKLWPEHKVGINVRIEKDGYCEVSVFDKERDSERFKMEQRSDGFKQFVSVLLTLSAETTMGVLKNNVILLDEPENSLHPGSVKFFRDELLRISENNYLVLATHSIFMIDKDCLQRHITVNKSENRTKISRIKNTFDDELIYSALGTSLFEILKSKMIIFEGDYDKKMFDFFHEKLFGRAKANSFGTTTTSGVNKIEPAFKFFNEVKINGIVIVDSDQKGRSVKQGLLNKFPQKRESILEIRDLVQLQKQDATLEDLIPEEIINDTLKQLYNITLSLSNEPILKQIKRSSQLMNGFEESSLKKRIIDNVIKDLKNLNNSQIEDKYSTYFKFYRNILKKITVLSEIAYIPKNLVKIEEN